MFLPGEFQEQRNLVRYHCKEGLQRVVHDWAHTHTRLLVICKTKSLYLYLIIVSYIHHSFLPCLHPRKLTIVISITIFLLCDWFQLMGSTSRRLNGRRREWSVFTPIPHPPPCLAVVLSVTRHSHSHSFCQVLKLLFHRLRPLWSSLILSLPLVP